MQIYIPHPRAARIQTHIGARVWGAFPQPPEPGRLTSGGWKPRLARNEPCSCFVAGNAAFSPARTELKHQGAQHLVSRSPARQLGAGGGQGTPRWGAGGAGGERPEDSCNLPASFWMHLMCMQHLASQPGVSSS